MADPIEDKNSLRERLEEDRLKMAIIDVLITFDIAPGCSLVD
jgi:cell fate regulator YaaT (PSP1 superfamily)